MTTAQSDYFLAGILAIGLVVGFIAYTKVRRQEAERAALLTELARAHLAQQAAGRAVDDVFSDSALAAYFEGREMPATWPERKAS